MAALSRALPKLAGGAPLERGAARTRWTTATGSVALAERRGDTVLLLVGAPPARSRELTAQLWRAFER